MCHSGRVWNVPDASHYLNELGSVCVKDCTSKTGRAGVWIMPPEYPAMLQTSVCVCVGEESHSHMSFCVLLQSAAVSDGGK